MRREQGFCFTLVESCECGEAVLPSARFGVMFPCSHLHVLGSRVQKPTAREDVQLIFGECRLWRGDFRLQFQFGGLDTVMTNMWIS
jgi:hypothetical protein